MVIGHIVDLISKPLLVKEHTHIYNQDNGFEDDCNQFLEF